MIRRGWTEIGFLGEGGTSRSSLGLVFLTCAANGHLSEEVISPSNLKSLFLSKSQFVSISLGCLQDDIYIYTLLDLLLSLGRLGMGLRQ